jgi:lipopolysaccharide heptosyltransferase I
VRKSPLGTSVKRLLIIKLSAMGDVVRALPAANTLHRQYPSLRITWAVEERFAPLVRGREDIDRVVTFPRFAWGAVDRTWMVGLRRALRELREEPYDLALDLQGLFKSSLVALAARAPRRLGVAPQREGAWLVSRPVPLPTSRLNVVDRYLACAASLGAPAEPVEFGLRSERAAAASVAELLRQGGLSPTTPVIAVSPSASVRWRLWPLARWVAVIDALSDSGAIVLLGGSEHRQRHAVLARQVRLPVLDLTGRTSLAELVALLDRCALHLATDTGSVHLAAALGRPVVAVYGPTPPWRAGPYGQLGGTVYHGDRCGIGCPRICVRRRACLLAVSPEEVIARARQVLSMTSVSKEDCA